MAGNNNRIALSDGFIVAGVIPMPMGIDYKTDRLNRQTLNPERLPRKNFFMLDNDYRLQSLVFDKWNLKTTCLSTR